MEENTRSFIAELFMEEGDEKALAELYNTTKDEIVMIALKWRKDKGEWKSDYADSMYEDIMSFIWDKYNLKNI